MKHHEFAPLPDTLGAEYLCVDEEAGITRIPAYLAGTLSGAQRQAFEDHLALCFKCQEVLAASRVALRALHDPGPGDQQPLPVIKISDYTGLDLQPYYDERPLTAQLAAASVRVGRVGFPVTVEYLQGQIVGEFHKRVGHLFFHLKRSTIGAKTVACTLIYAPASDSGVERTFEFQEGEEKRLGPWQDFAASETIQDVVQTLKRFRLVVK